jgi:hypothetical protein
VAVVGTMAAVMAIPVAAYSAYLWSVSGQLLTGKWYNVVLHEDRAGVSFLERYARNVIALESTLAAELSLVVVVLAALGMALAFRTLDRPVATVLLLALVLPAAAIATFAVGPRFLAPFFPLLFILASGALVALEARVRGRAGRALAVTALAAAVLHTAPVLAYPLRFSPWGDVQMTEHRDVGRWILERYGAGRRILTRSPELVFYAQGELRPLPDIGPESLAAEAMRTGSELVVIDELLIRRHRPRLVALLGDHAPDGLTLVHDVTPHPGRRVRVFQSQR